MAKKLKRPVGRPKAKVKGLTAQQRRFCQLWVQKFNLADAWLGAGYKSKKRADARVTASKFLLTNLHAQAYVTKLLERQADRAEKTADDIIREMEFLGFSNMQDFVETDPNGEFVFKDWSTLSREQLAAVASVKVTKTTRRKGKEDVTVKNITFKLHNKHAALQDLGKRYRLFSEDHKLNVGEKLENFIEWLSGRNGGGNGNGDGNGSEDQS